MLLYIVIFLVLGFLLLFAELFVPGGLIGLLGLCLMGIAVWMCFDHYGSHEGLLVLLFCIVGSILFVTLAFKLFPHSVVGRWFILNDSIENDQPYGAIDTGEELVGKEGVTDSELRPAGIAVIEGNRYDVVTEGEFVEPHSRIRVIRIDSNRIVVTQI